MPISTNGVKNLVKEAKTTFPLVISEADDLEALKSAVLLLARRVAQLEKQVTGEDNPVDL